MSKVTYSLSLIGFILLITPAAHADFLRAPPLPACETLLRDDRPPQYLRGLMGSLRQSCERAVAANDLRGVQPDTPGVLLAGVSQTNGAVGVGLGGLGGASVLGGQVASGLNAPSGSPGLDHRQRVRMYRAQRKRQREQGR